jgi:hypothetical protein
MEGPRISFGALGPLSASETSLHSKIEQGDRKDSDEGVLQVRRSRADAGNEAT